MGIRCIFQAEKLTFGEFNLLLSYFVLNVVNFVLSFKNKFIYLLQDSFIVYDQCDELSKIWEKCTPRYHHPHSLPLEDFFRTIAFYCNSILPNKLPTKLTRCTRFTLYCNYVYLQFPPKLNVQFNQFGKLNFDITRVLLSHKNCN